MSFNTSAKFFVMLNTPEGEYIPLNRRINPKSPTTELATFTSFEDAEKMAKATGLGNSYGYTVFDVTSDGQKSY